MSRVNTLNDKKLRIEDTYYFILPGFGIGVQAGSVYLDDLSMAILRLSDSGVITELEET